jgi:hypothetical protein
MDQNKKKDDDEHVTHCCPFVFAECEKKKNKNWTMIMSM